MLIRTAQWNIGGGRVRPSGSNLELEGSYSIDGLENIGQALTQQTPDIITLQETHSSDSIKQTEIIAKCLGFSHFINDIYDQSHIDDGQKLGQAIISKFPITDHFFSFFYNPHYEVNRSDGTKWVCHDKGLSVCFLQLPNNSRLVVATLHLIPFRKFGINPLESSAKQVKDDIESKIKAAVGNERFLLQGDFNFDNPSLTTFLSGIFSEGVLEITADQGTTPKGRKYDHIVYRGLKLLESRVDSSALTDHYPIFSEFKI